MCAAHASNWSAHLETEVNMEAAPFAVGMSHCVLSVDVLISNCCRVEGER